MRKRTSNHQASDINLLAKSIVQMATKQKPVAITNLHEAAVALGRLGGKKGGPARAKKLPPKKRSQIARKAAMARWGSRS